MKNILNLEDEKLVELVRKNKEYFIHIIKRYEDKLLRYAGYLTKDDDVAMDIVQETFIKAFINLNGFNTKMKFSSWIYRIAHNESLSFIRKVKREVPIHEKLDLKSSTNIEEEFISSEERKKVLICLNDIPIIYREPMSLFYLENKSYTEIGDILKIPLGTVGIRIKRGKDIMKNICKKR